uniref:Rho-GAP domain-containing protein n=1 Tax=Strongyloides stercoralis TaxID=6248 RepID=A0AAF5I2N6_STRER
MASSWSSSENVNDITIENSLSEDLLRDIELFSEHINRLRISLDSSSYVPDGESKCVQIHAALSMVSQSVRDLLVRYPLFKTSHVLIPTSQLVHSIKEINFADAVLDASKTLACIDKLEGAVGNTLKQSLDVSISMLNITNKNKNEPGKANRLVGKYSTPTMSSQTPKPSSKIPLVRRHSSLKHKFSYDNNSPLIPGDKLDEFLADQEDGISVAFECNKNQSKHFKDIITYIKKRIDLEHEHASKIMALTKETRIAFKNEKHLPLLEHYMGCFECDLNFCENVYKVYDSINDKVKEFEKKREEQEHFKRSLKNEFSKDIKKLKDCENELVKARNALISKEDGYIKAKNSTMRSEKNVISFTYSIDHKRSLKEMDKRKRNEDTALAKVDEAKSYVKKMEGEMCRKIQSVDRAKRQICLKIKLHDKNIDNNICFYDYKNSNIYQKLGHKVSIRIHQERERFHINIYVNKFRESEKDLSFSREKILKILFFCVQYYLKCFHKYTKKIIKKTNFERKIIRKVTSIYKIIFNFTHFNNYKFYFNIYQSVSDCHKLIKNDRNLFVCFFFDVFMNIVYDWKPFLKTKNFNHFNFMELTKIFFCSKKCFISDTKYYDKFFVYKYLIKKATISQLRELIYHCDQSTKACSIYYFQALSELWDSLPGTYQELSDAIRNYTPGTEYMSFLQNLPKRPLSSSSGLRKNLAKCESDEYLLKNNSKNKSLFGSDRLFGDNEISAAVARRRNALNLEDHNAIPLAHTSRRQKKSMSRLFDSNIDDPSEAAKSHKLQRVRQPTKCSYCENISLLSTYQCTICDTFYHKTCLSRLTAYCNGNLLKLTSNNNNNNNLTNSEGRRMSIFGIPLENSLTIEECKIPFILERCIYEIEIRGMRCKGIYRTCGVKSKIEQICEDFEKLETDKDIKLCDIHPMNVASVIKLYLRKLPEPVMTFSLQKEWISIANAIDPNNPDLTKLIECSKKLPPPNYTTLRYLLIHLNRVTWYESENLMNAFNLANVIAPSLMWTKIPSPTNRKKSSNSKDKKIFQDHATLYSDAHIQTKVFEYLIKYAYEVFGIDINEDKKQFFTKFPSNRLDDWDEPTTTELVDEIDDIDDKDAFGSDGHLEYISSTSKKSISNILSPPNFVKESLSPGDLLYSNDNNINQPSSENVDRYLSQNLTNMMSNNDKEELNLPNDKYPYTTSILITPQTDRKIYYSQSNMMSENISGPTTSTDKKIQSEDVPVDMYKNSSYLNYNKHDNLSKNTPISADIRNSLKGTCSYESDRCTSAKVTSKKFDSQL